MAILTNPIKKQVIQDLKTDMDSSGTHYYAVIGRSVQWDSADTVPTAVNSAREERNFRLSLQSAKKVADLTFCVPRYNWSSGAIYSAYDDSQVGYPTQTYYVMNDENQVYLCIQRGTNLAGQAQVSTVQPTGGTDGVPFDTADGYIWKFLYSIGAADATKFMSANYIPVKLQGATDGSSTASEVEQLAIQNAATVGQIIGYAVDSGGAGYTDTPTITIAGNGTLAKAGATVSGGQVSKVTLIDSSGTLMFGSGYNYATVSVTGGGSPTKPAKVRAILGSPLGLGGDPRDDLRSTAIMLNTKPVGDESTDFIVGNDFRQVGIMKNPLIGGYDSAGALFTDTTAIALKKLNFASVTSGFVADELITGAISGAKAYVDKVGTNELHYHQTEDTGFTAFNSGEQVTSTAGSGTTAASNHITTPEIDIMSGEVLYIDNRAKVARASDQTEDIKLVIQI
jgi:hypothetical protein